jgi:hypothetical protein
MVNKTTSPKVAHDAGKLLSNPRSPAKVKEVAGSAVSQAKPKKHK